MGNVKAKWAKQASAARRAMEGASGRPGSTFVPRLRASDPRPGWHAVDEPCACGCGGRLVARRVGIFPNLGARVAQILGVRQGRAGGFVRPVDVDDDLPPWT